MGSIPSSKHKVAMKHLRDRKYTLEKSLLLQQLQTATLLSTIQPTSVTKRLETTFPINPLQPEKKHFPQSESTGKFS